jgi:glycine/D-amino acid oxidase-like deaminating enzyme
MKEHFGPYQLELTNEWSGTVGYTADEYPIVGSVDGQGSWIIAGMCGSGSGVSFNAASCLVNRILQLDDEQDDYPPEYFAPSRLLDPAGHRWPDLEATDANGGPA